MFDDQYLGRSDNASLLISILDLLARERQVLTVERDRPEYSEPSESPDIEALSERLRSCLQDSEEIPVDFTQLFDLSLSQFNLRLVPEVIKLYEVRTWGFISCSRFALINRYLFFFPPSTLFFLSFSSASA